jgi:hypothetical protein
VAAAQGNVFFVGMDVMTSLTWTKEKLPFRGSQVEALVARSARADVLELEMELKGPTLPNDEILVIRYPPLIAGEVIGHSPKGKPLYKTICPDIELWRIENIGSFDSIRLAKAAFNAPDDKYFREGVDSIDAIIAMLSEKFEQGDFKLNHVYSAILSFELTRTSAKVTRKQHTLLDRLNERFFHTDSTGKHMKSVYLNAPHCFTIGAA